MKTEAKLLTLMITTRCTLRCRHCTVAIPKHTPINFSTDELARAVAETFRIVDYTGHLVVQGGEPFLHPHFADIISELAKYKSQFGYLLFITNGTYIPDEKTLHLLAHADCKYMVRVDDYNVINNKVKELSEIFKKRGIHFEVRHYNNDEQYCGGWVDVLGDFLYHNYSKTELARVFTTCLNKEDCRFIWRGKIWGCGMHGSGVLLGKVPDKSADFVDLFSDEPIEVKRRKFSDMGKAPYEGCNYCNGFNPEYSPRIKAAEQF